MREESTLRQPSDLIPKMSKRRREYDGQKLWISSKRGRRLLEECLHTNLGLDVTEGQTSQVVCTNLHKAFAYSRTRNALICLASMPANMSKMANGLGTNTGTKAAYYRPD
jgi:hypothetical protein